MSGTCSTSQWECKSKVKTSTFAFANFTFALLFSYLLVLKSIASNICFSGWEWAIILIYSIRLVRKTSTYIWKLIGLHWYSFLHKMYSFVWFMIDICKWCASKQSFKLDLILQKTILIHNIFHFFSFTEDEANPV